MIKKSIQKLVVLASFILFLSACSNRTDSLKADGGGRNMDKIQIVTTISQIGEPLSFIGGGRVEVKSLMGPSVDPHLYKATHGDISTINKAEMVFYNGLNLEANLTGMFKEIGKSKPVIAVGETIPEDLLLYDEQGTADPHIWFDIDLWMTALDASVKEMKKYSPEDADFFEKNKKEYFQQLADLKNEAKILMEIPAEKRVLVTAHDAFGYFGRAHDMIVVGLQGLSTDAEIGISDIQETIDLIVEYQVPAVFIESSVNESSINAVIEGVKALGLDVNLGGQLFSDAMGEAGTEEGTYIGMYRHNVLTIYEALKRREDLETDRP